MSGRVAGRVISYVVLVLIGLAGIAPFLYLLVLSFKSRLDVLTVPPDRHFDWATIQENYRTVIHDDHYVTFVVNSLVAFSLPLVIWIMIGFFDEIPREIDESAMVDGLTRPLVLLRVLLPLARPGMLVAATFGVIFVWNEFLVGLYLVNSTDKETIPIAASSLLTVESPIDWNIAATVGILTVIPILIFSMVVQRYIVRGITAGAVR
jgi:ABC-type glycerol-3-phosphate transport system permease component